MPLTSIHNWTKTEKPAPKAKINIAPKLPFTEWQSSNLVEAAEDAGVHKNDAYQQWESGVDNDITLAAEDENGIYAAYIDRLVERLAKHEKNYNSHLKGSTKTQEFTRDMEITKRLMEDFMAYMERFIKTTTAAAKKVGGSR